jgi:tripartite-type tricarboxylate transporter receptor subunit TctC
MKEPMKYSSPCSSARPGSEESLREQENINYDVQGGIMTRKLRTASLVVFVLIGMFGTVVHGADWPNKTIKLVIGYGAGGSTDTVSRFLANKLEQELGVPVICENKPGGGGTVAAALASAQKPDGYFLFTFVTAPAFLTPHQQNVPFDPLKDFTVIARVAKWHYALLVKADAPWKTLEEFLAYAKANPNKVSYGISGVGNPQDLMMEYLKQTKGIEWKKIPYSNGPEAIAATLGGHVSSMVGVAEWVPQGKEGTLRLLATFDEERMKMYPDVPTLKDLGYDISAPSLYSIAAPKGLSKDKLEKLEKAIKKAYDSPEFQSLLDKMYMIPAFMGNAEITPIIKETNAKMGKIINDAGLGKK